MPPPPANQPLPTWRWPLAYALSALTFLVLDTFWLTSTHQTLYRPAIGHLMAPTVDFTAAGIFYVLYIAGVVVFAVAPGMSAGRPALAWAKGALLGLLAYATYDLTNQATLRDWPWHVTLIDLVWGSTVTGVTAWVATALTLATCRRASRTSGR